MVCDPSALVALLLGAPLEMPAALTVARIGGAAVLSLGVACWITGHSPQPRRERPGRRDVVVQHRHRRWPHIRRSRLTDQRRRVMAGGCSPRADGRLVCRVPISPSPDCGGGQQLAASVKCGNWTALKWSRDLS